MNKQIEEGILILKSNDPVQKRIIENTGPCTLRPSKNYFTDLVSSIISQQLSVTAANAIHNRLLEACGSSINPGTISKLRFEELRAAGISNQKAGYLHSLAEHFKLNAAEMDRVNSYSDQEIINSLCKIKGIGEWTAHMFLIFSLNRLDVLPLGDVSFKRSFAIQYNVDRSININENIISASKKWGDYKSIAAWYLWYVLDSE